MRPTLLSTSFRHFTVVAETRSLSAAALQLHVAVSAVSRQITNLEDAFGCPLFERHARGMELSPAGLRLAEFGRAMNADVERVIDEVRGEAHLASSIVRMACTEGFSSGFMPPVMSAFRAKHPDASIHLQVVSPDEVSRLLRQGEVDVGLKYCVEPEPGLHTLHRQLSPVMALVAPRHPLSKSRSVTIKQLVRYALAMPEKGTTIRQAFDLCCAANDLHYATAFTGNAATLLQLATQGEAILPFGYLSAAHLVASGALRALRIEEPEFQTRSLHVLALSGRTLPSMASDFAEHLLKAVRLAAGPRMRPAPGGARPLSKTKRAVKNIKSSRVVG